MRELNTSEKLEKVLTEIESKGISSNSLAENTGLNQSGLHRIIKGKVKNPHKSTVDVLYQYFFSTNTNKEVEKTYIEVQGVKVSLEEWALKTAEHAKELKKLNVFNNIIKIEKLKDFISFTSHLTPEDLKLLNKDAVKEFLGE